MTRTQLLAERIATELERASPYLNLITDLRSVQIDVKFVKDTGAPRVVIIKTETEN